MAKSGLDYFPLNCQLDEKFELIEAEFGLTGFAVVVKLLQRIYGEHGYYCEWTNEVEMIFARQLAMSREDVNLIVQASVRRGIFSEDLFRKFEVLTSKGIQKRFLEAVSRRKEIELKNEYLLVEVGNLKKNVSILDKNVDINSKNVDILKQSRVEESRGEESRVEESRVRRDSADPLSPFGKFKNVFLTDQELQDLEDLYRYPKKLIDRLSSYKSKCNKTYDNDYATLLDWADKDGDQRKPKAEPEPDPIDAVPMPDEIKKAMKSIFKEV